MSDMLIEIYEALLKTLPGETTYYKKALSAWDQALKTKGDMELEDAARAREYEYGFLAFLTGIRLARTLEYE